MSALHALKSLARMMLPKRHDGEFIRRRRFRITLFNISSQQPLAQIQCRPLGLTLGSIALFLAIGAIWLVIFTNTPLRNILPVKMQSDLRHDYLTLSQRLDSANMVANVNLAYLDNLISILNDSVDAEKSKKQQVQKAADELLPLDSLMESSNAERSFVRRFENAERFNVSVLAPIAAEGMTFYPPVMGIPTEERTSDAGIHYAYAIPANSSPISAIYRGTVINTYFVTGRGITVAIQHPNDFLTLYTGLSECFVARGEKVDTGSRIGIAQGQKYPFTFELWHNGSPLRPKEYVLF